MSSVQNHMATIDSIECACEAHGKPILVSARPEQVRPFSVFLGMKWVLDASVSNLMIYRLVMKSYLMAKLSISTFTVL